ncbi:hypothetical protein, partial [Morganella morganii]|uniref:hypothetical protein n=1 Tax=Morganella morganii TaxID=582 RepID=UPI001C71725C
DNPKRKASPNTINVFAAPELKIPFDMVLPNLSNPPKPCTAEYANPIIDKTAVFSPKKSFILDFTLCILMFNQSIE